MKKRTFMLVAIVLLVGSLLFAQGATEKAFPNKQITIVCQANPGGSSDLNCRTIAPGMEAKLGVPVTVENRPGAGGGIGISYGAAAAPDGYVITHLPVDVTQIKPAGNADVTPADFRFLARVSYHPAAIAVKADSKYKTIQDLVDAAKANPGQITIGNSGTGAVWHLSAVQFEQAAGCELNHIPFEGAAPSITALLGGHIDATCCSAAEVRAQVQSGELRLLVVMSDEPFGLFPEVPTAKSLGIDVSVLCWLAFGVPKATPDDVFNTLLDAVRESYNSDTYQKMLESNGYVPGWMEAAEIDAYAAQEYEVYRKLIPQVLGYPEV